MAERPCGHDHDKKEHGPCCCHECWLYLQYTDSPAYWPSPRLFGTDATPVYAETFDVSSFYGAQTNRINDHGVHVLDMSGTVVPMVCFSCPALENDYDDWSQRVYTFCSRYLILPTRKGTCKLRDRLLAASA